MTKKRLATLQKAARLIEVDSTEAFHAVSKRYGRDIAEALIVAYVRRCAKKGIETREGTVAYPPPPEIDESAEKMLRQCGILEEPNGLTPGKIVLFEKLPTNAIFRPAAPTSPHGPNVLFRKTSVPSTAVSVEVVQGKYVDNLTDLNEFADQNPVMVIVVP